LTRRLRFTLAVVVIAWFACWLLQAESSPLREYLLWHPRARNIWLRANFPGVLLGFLVSGNVHQPSVAGYLLGITIQWAVVGLVASLVAVRRRGHKT
jgi:hypothetical protein